MKYDEYEHALSKCPWLSGSLLRRSGLLKIRKVASHNISHGNSNSVDNLTMFRLLGNVVIERKITNHKVA